MYVAPAMVLVQLQGGSVFSDPRVSTALTPVSLDGDGRAIYRNSQRTLCMLGCAASPLMDRWGRWAGEIPLKFSYAAVRFRARSGEAATGKK